MILGPLRVQACGTDVAVHGARQARLIAALALDAGTSVGIDRLVDVVWPDDAPSTARRQVQDLISRLRRDLAAVGCGPPAVTMRGGRYVLNLPDPATDLAHFRGLVADVRRLRPADPAAASEQLRQGLALWRGDALAGLSSPALDPARFALDELRLATWEQCIDLDLELGRHADVLPELDALVQSHPLREHLVRSYLRALYRVGRTAQAIEVFHQLRRQLSDELGVRPGPDVQAMYDAIVTNDPQLMADAPAAAPPLSITASPAPDTRAQRKHEWAGVPKPPSFFVGRHDELSALDAAAARHDGAVLLAGLPGAGKSSLALHWVHRYLRTHDDSAATVFCDLRGYALSPPATPAEVMTHVLRGLGLAADSLPTDADDLLRAYRREIEAQRPLLIFDDARDEGQIRDLLARGPMLTLVTGRTLMPELERQGTVRIVPVGPLDASSAAALLRMSLPAEPATAGQLAELADRCGHMPLALRVAATSAEAGPTGIAGLLAQLRDAPAAQAAALPDRLNGVWKSIESSYRRLPPAAARTLRLFAATPCRWLDADMVAAMLGEPPTVAQTQLDQLVRRCLVDTDGVRYQAHDLVRQYAGLVDPQDVDPDAWLRLLAFYAVTIDRVGHRVGRNRMEPWTLAVTGPLPAVVFDGQDEALAWTDRHLPNIVTLVEACAQTEPKAFAWEASRRLMRYFWLRRKTREWYLINDSGLSAARQAADTTAVAQTLTSVGVAHWANNATDAAIECFQEAYDHNLALGRIGGMTSNLANLAGLHVTLGRLSQAAVFGMQSVQLARAGDDPVREANALLAVTTIHRELGRLRAAHQHASRAVRLYEAAGNVDGEISVLQELAAVHLLWGDGPAALAAGQRALLLADRIGSVGGRVCAREEMAYALVHEGRVAEALLAAAAGIQDAEESADTNLISAILRCAGAAALANGDLDEAEERADEALRIGRTHRNMLEEAAALILEAEIYLRSGSAPAALRCAEDGAAAARTAGLQLRAAMADVVIAEALSGQGRHQEAQATAARATVALNRAGAAVWLDRARSLLAVAPPSDSLWPVATSTRSPFAIR